MQHKVALPFKSVDETLASVRTIQMKAIDQYFHVALFFMQYKVVLTLRSVDKTPLCEYSNVSYRAVLSCGTVYSDVHGGLTFKLSFC